MTDVSLLQSLSRPNSQHAMHDRTGNSNGGALPEQYNKRNTGGDGEGEDVVARMKRDMSYHAMARHGNHNHSSDSDEESDSSFHSDHDGNTKDGLSSSQMTHKSVGSASPELEAILKEEQDVTDAIEARRLWVLSLLGVLAVLAIIAMGAVAAGIQTERDFIEDMEDSHEIQQMSTTQPEYILTNITIPEDTLTAANKIQQRNLHQSLKSFANVMTQQAQTTTPGSSWPFFTNPLFEVQGQPTRAMLPQIDLLAFSPLVTLAQQSEWNDYSWEQQHWIRDTWELLGYSATEVPLSNISPTIYQSAEEAPGSILAPLWQTSPPPMEAFKINYNMLSHPVLWELYQEITSTPVTTNMLDFVAAVSPVVEGLPYRYGVAGQQLLLNMDDTNTMNSPRIVLVVPVRETLAESANTVGLLQVLVNWEEYLRQIVPLQKGDGTALIRNNCGQSFSFRILDSDVDDDVSRVSYLGRNYSETELPLDMENSSGGMIIVEDVLGIPGTGNGSCTYSLEFTPLQSTSQQQQPQQQQQQQQQQEIDHDIVGTLVVALISLLTFLFALALMGFYMKQWNDHVELRHEKLVHSAAKSSAIVASMFPSTIRDRLMKQTSNAMMGDLSSSNNHNSVSAGETKRTSDKKKKKKKKLLGSGSLKNSSRKRTNGGSNLSDIGESGTENNMEVPDTLTANEGGQATAVRQRDPERFMLKAGSERLKNYFDNGLTPDEASYSAPIADLFPNCTVVFADIVGFTAWSSVREPTQVFQLLETLYKAYDDIAKKRKVFKVETTGDSYTAVTGLPEAQEDHALIMVRFARDCMYKSYELTKKLEVSLGPDTGDLSMRFGLHSGPVTAGVLRGERSRFQLFGDTVNTASRMESTGQKGRIQMTKETADILVSMGKSHLVRQREDKVSIMGKGEMTTFWMALGADPDDFDEEEAPPPLMLNRNSSGGVNSIIEGNEDDTTDRTEEEVEMEQFKDEEDPMNNSSKRRSRDRVPNIAQGVGPRGAPTQRRPPAVSMSGFGSFKSPREKKMKKESRLVDWNVEVLSKLLKHVIARRNALGLQGGPEEVKLDRPDDQTVLEEVREIITLPKFDASAAKKQEDPEKTELDPDVKEQLRDYVSILASMYRDNSFHNYEHASHVTMSVVKLLSRIVAPKAVDRSKMTSAEKMSGELHDHTYGITSDPLTQFAVVLSALIHDVDHTGVPNAQLVNENARVAALYKNKSIAEQNSLDLAWNCLMEPQFKDLRTAIYCDESELTRFRSLLVNSVMATDIADKDQKQFRNARWEKAFSGEVPQTEQEVNDAVNRKATIVLEHLIQASDVSHTMQHWHVYRKWNERLFFEMHNAYRAGRAEKDPQEFWYKGEIGFFDFYIIPLAKKLKECGVFGVSSDEYLTYALKNREEWIRKGEAVTAEMVAKSRDRDLARMERQASVRGPVIAEMKAAALAMRPSPKIIEQPFRQASFRHLSVEPQETETIAMPAHDFQRQAPTRRRTPSRPTRGGSVRGIGAGMGMRKPERRGSNTPGSN